ncbi:hypothetical protein BDV93DRAFT_523791 [Ceratobasidium sp. AG-I]|nr:hypothetical protein BDV93DRAFT_523791 [Ceratobasidium sp. AG-I]
MFQDPITGRVVKIYLDQKHIQGQIYAALRNIVENGGGRITSKQDSASIWIVNPDAPYALGEWKEGVPVLFAPWLFACATQGSLLGTNHGNWCGFKVPPQNKAASGSQLPAQAVSHPITHKTPKLEPPIAHPTPQDSAKKKAKPKPKSTLDFSRWTHQMTQTALGYPKDSFPAVKDVDLSDIPIRPSSSQWGAANSAGKRAFSNEELEWMVGVIEWCLTKHPKMSGRAAVRIMGMVATHRSTDSYAMYVMRHLIWFSDRSPRFREHMRKHQAECDADPLFSVVPSTLNAASSSSAPQPQIQTPTVAQYPASLPHMNQTAFTDKDWDDFIRYAAARPNGMEPIGSETAAQVWKIFADKHRRHNFRSWRTWHQHRQDILTKKVHEFRMGSV